jgi:hypothetical protein
MAFLCPASHCHPPFPPGNPSRSISAHHGPTFHPSALPIFHSSIAELFLEKMKIQITIEEQILTAFRLSPVLRLRSVSIVRRPPSMVNGPSSTFNLQPSNLPPSILPTADLILQKLNSNNKSEQFPAPPLFPLFAPDSRAWGRKKDRIEPCLPRFVPKQLVLPME